MGEGAKLGSEPAQGPAEEEIVLRASRDDRSSIDRETYIVRDTPLAQTRSATEVLQTLPSVSVDPSGQLRLLGSRSVKILIDGRDVPNAAAMLANLQASQIARIEVMTNPSAQYSAYGSGGIINVILRRTFARGLGGSAVAGVGTQDYVNLRLSPTLSNGRWTFAASPSLTLNDSTTERRLDREGRGPTPAIGRAEAESGTGSSRAVAAMTQVSFVPDSKERYDLTGNMARQDGRASSVTTVSSPVGSFEPFLETSNGRASLDSESLSLERKVTGPRDKEELKLALSWSRFTASSHSRFADLLPLETRNLELAYRQAQSSSGAKADYARPLGKHDLLSVGAEIQRESQSILDSFVGSTGAGPVSTSDTFSGHYLDLSAYATLQTRLASIKILPGLRVQRRRFGFPGAAGLNPTGATLLFPSLHAERAFGKLTATFSIASRADWPSISQLSPYRRVTGPTTADVGNPNLEPERSFNIEAGARIAVANQQLSMTLYDRHRRHVQSTAVTAAPDGAILSVPVNSGTRVARGGQVSLRGRFCRTCRYSASAWVSDARFDALEGVRIVRESALEYGGNAQLEASSGEQGKSGYRLVTLNLRYFGPTRALQTRAGSLSSVDLSYTQYLSGRLSLVATAARLIGTRHIATERFSPDFTERTVSQIVGPLFRISLTYNLAR